MKFIYLVFFTLISTLFKMILSRTNIDFSFYHKTADIERIMNELKSTCYPNLKEVSADQILQNEENNPLISKLKYYDITSPSKSNPNNTNNKLRTNRGEKINIFLLAGEHPRELISTEFILNYVKYLCMGNRDEKYLNIINSFNFRIVLNANPISREKVENGEYCRRTNLNNVDINRNWDIHWILETNDPEEFPGNSPFSEMETKFLKSIVGDFKPKLFLSVHSGAFGLFMPYAYLQEEGKFNLY